MWFKNLQIFVSGNRWQLAPADFEEALAASTLQPVSGLQWRSEGWVSPRGDAQLVFSQRHEEWLAVERGKAIKQQQAAAQAEAEARAQVEAKAKAQVEAKGKAKAQKEKQKAEFQARVAARRDGEEAKQAEAIAGKGAKAGSAGGKAAAAKPTKKQ